MTHRPPDPEKAPDLRRKRLLRAEGSMAGATGLLGLSRIVGAVLGYVSTIVIVRHLSTTEWGYYAFVFSLLGLIGVIADLQMGRVVYAALDRDPRPGEVAGSYFLLRGLIGSVSYLAALAVLAAGYGNSAVLQLGLVAGLSLVVGNLVGAVGSVYTSERWFGALAGASVLGQAASFTALLLLALSGWQPELLLFAVPSVLKDVITLLLLMWLLRARFRLRLLAQPATWWAWLKEVAPLSIGGAVTVAYTRIDALMLGKLDSLESVGFYAIGYRFADLLGFLALTLSAVVLPSLVRTWPDQLDNFHRVFRHAFVLSFGLAAGGALVFVLVAPQAIEVAFGTRYVVVADSARLLVLSEALHFITVLCFITLTAVRRTLAYPLVVLGGLAVNVAANFVVIPRYSYTGAAVVTLVTEVFVAATLLWLVFRVPGVRPLPLRSGLVICLACAVAAGAGIGSLRVLPWPIAAVLAAVVFLAGLQVLRIEGRGGLIGLLRGARLDLQPPQA